MKVSLRSVGFSLLTVAIVAAFLGVILNLWTIATFPSWFDEAFMANISFNVANGKGRLLDLMPTYQQGEVNIYGPTYFALQASLIRLFGLHGWLFRSPNLLAGYLVIGLLSLCLRQLRLPTHAVALFALVAVLDISINRNMVSGRMDMLAVAFVSAALLFAIQRTSGVVLTYVFSLLSGLLLACAFLTTPRSLFLFPVVAVMNLSLLRSSPKTISAQHAIAATAIFLAGILAPIAQWVWALGGPFEYLSLFADNSVARAHISPSFFRSAYDNIAIVVMIVLLFLKRRTIQSSPLAIGLLLNYIAFSLFVKEEGPYAGMINPFILMLIITLLFLQSGRSTRALPALALILLLIPSTIVMYVRLVDLTTNASCRDPAPLVKAYHQYADQAGRSPLRIVAPFKHYFLLESPRNNLITTDYSQLSINDLLDRSDVIVAGGDVDSARLAESGFSKLSSGSCRARRLIPLTPQFASKSSFDESLYGLKKPENANHPR